MTKRIMITLPEDVLSKLEIASKESMRPIATEALYRVKLGLNLEIAEMDITPVKGFTKEAKETLSESNARYPSRWGKAVPKGSTGGKK